MMICKNCNSEVPESAKFCASCGTPVEQQAAPAAASAVCRSCNSPLAEGTKFCSVCGTAVETAPVFQPAAPVPPTAPVPPAAPVPPVMPVPVEAAQPVVPVEAAPSIPQVAEPVAPVAPVAEPVQPVMEAPVAVSQPVEAPAPVNETPEPIREAAPMGNIPQPVNDVMPEPVREAVPVGAFPQPVNDVMPQPVNTGEAAANTANTFAQAPVSPSTYSAPMDMDVAGIQMDAASSAVVKPVKKSKLGLWIGLGVAGVAVAAAAVCGLCFRGVIANVFMGDNKYAAKVEADTFKSVVAGQIEATAEDKAQVVDAITSAVSAMSTTQDNYGSAEDAASAFAGMDLPALISAYNTAFVEVYGAEGVMMELDADINLTEEGKANFGDAASVDEVLKVINDSTFAISYQAGEDALAAEVTATDAEGFTINARGVVTADGTVAVMLPFATDKAIKITLETDGTVSSAEPVEFELDPVEIERISTELANTYLEYIEKAEVSVEKGSMKAGDANAEGRLVSVEMDEELIAEMTTAMITFLAEDDYFMDKFAEFMEIAGEDYTESELKKELEDSLENLEDEINFTFAIQTLVDNNGNILAKSYAMDIDEEGETSFTYVGGDEAQGLVVVVDDEDFLTADITPVSETDGKIEMVFEDAEEKITVNVEYEGVKTEKYLNTETMVGKYDVDIEFEDGNIGFTAESAVDGDKMTSKISVELDKYGNVAFTVAVQPEDRDLTAIPSGALDLTDADNWTEEEAKANAQYMLDALNEIKAKCEANTSSTFAGLIAPMADSGIEYFDNLLTPMASYEDISSLSDGISELMVQLSSTYDANYEYVSDATYNECSDLYDELDELYDEVAYAYEMDMDTYNTLSAKASDLADKAEDLCNKIVEEADAAREQAASAQTGFAGLWEAFEIVQGGEVSSPDDWNFSSMIYIFEDGTYYWDWSGSTTYGDWEANGDVLSFYEEDALQEFVLSGDVLSYEADGGIVVRYARTDA